MKIALVLQVADPADIDAMDGSGLTAAADNRLMAALLGAGFEIVTGPLVTEG
jgi:hypothetical protein